MVNRVLNTFYSYNEISLEKRFFEVVTGIVPKSHGRMINKNKE